LRQSRHWKLFFDALVDGIDVAASFEVIVALRNLHAARGQPEDTSLPVVRMIDSIVQEHAHGRRALGETGKAGKEHMSIDEDDTLTRVPSLQHLCRQQVRREVLLGQMDCRVIKDDLPEWVFDYVAYGQAQRLHKMAEFGETRRMLPRRQLPHRQSML
jgi:hypothetical protein